MPNYYDSRQPYTPKMGGFSFFPPMIKFLLLTNILVFLTDTLIFSTLVIDGESLWQYFRYFFALQHIQTGAFYPWQLITYQFMHADIGHLFWNMFALWIFGVELENVWGTRRFVQFYLLSGVGAGLIQLATSLLPDAQLVPTVGASGSIFGLLLAFGLTFPDRPIMMFPIFFPIPAKIFVLIYGGIDLLQGIFSPNSGVAHFAHLGGAFFGYMLLKHGDDLRIFSFLDAIMRPFSRGGKSIQRKKKRNIYSLYKKHDTSQECSEKGSGYCISNGDEITQTEIDRILDKISSSGYKSLSDREKKILYEVSKKM